MKRICFLLSLILLVWFASAGCGKISADFPDGNFHLLIISDTHISNDESKIDRLRELNRRINKGMIPGIMMVIHTGDVVSSVYRTYRDGYPDSLNFRLSRAVSVFSELEVPWYWIMGNHDYKIDSDRDSDAPFRADELKMIEEIWKETTHFNPYYAVFYRGWKFIFLNSMRGCYQQRNFDKEQLAWLHDELEERIPAILFFHHPLKTDHFRLWEFSSRFIETEKEPVFYEILEKYQNRIKGIFVGHEHHYISDRLFEKIPVYQTASFADDTSGPYLIVGFDDSNKSIQVARGCLLK